MSDEHALRRRPQAAEPVEQALLVGVRRKVVKLCNLGPDRDVFAVDLHLGRAGGDRRPARAAGLKSGEEDRVLRIRREGPEVVQHAPARRHAARRDDHHRAATKVQRFRFDRRAHDLGGLARAGTFLDRQSMLWAVAVVELGHVHRHRAVQEHRHIGDRIRFPQPVDRIQQRLRAADGKGRDHDDAAAVAGAPDDLADALEWIAHVMKPVPVRRLDDHRVGREPARRRQHDEVVGTPEVA